jgi:hypothetical protein
MSAVPRLTLTRTKQSDLQTDFSDALLGLSADEYEQFLLDAKRAIESALLDAQANLTSEAGWQANG